MKRLQLVSFGHVHDLTSAAVEHLLQCVNHLPIRKDETDSERPHPGFIIYYLSTDEARFLHCNCGSFFILVEVCDGFEHILESGGADRLREDGHGHLVFRGFCTKLSKHIDFRGVPAESSASRFSST